MSKAAEKIEIRNIVSPNHGVRVAKAKYTAMRDALLQVLPATTLGLTVAETKAAVLPIVSEELFPGGDKAGWWLKAAQLDLESKGIMQREATKPLRLYRAQ